MDRKACPRCGDARAVHVERIIKADKTEHQLVCGVCEHVWRDGEPPPEPTGNTKER
jgi:hypothetical protein